MLTSLPVGGVTSTAGVLVTWPLHCCKGGSLWICKRQSTEPKLSLCMYADHHMDYEDPDVFVFDKYMPAAETPTMHQTRSWSMTTCKKASRSHWHTNMSPIQSSSWGTKMKSCPLQTSLDCSPQCHPLLPSRARHKCSEPPEKSGFGRGLISKTVLNFKSTLEKIERKWLYGINWFLYVCRYVFINFVSSITNLIYDVLQKAQ